MKKQEGLKKEVGQIVKGKDEAIRNQEFGKARP